MNKPDTTALLELMKQMQEGKISPEDAQKKMQEIVNMGKDTVNSDSNDGN